MKFSAFTTALNAISLKMMGISSPAQNQIGAIGSNDLIQGANSFWETLGVILLRTFADIFITIWEMLVKLVYAIAKWLLTIIDFLFIFIRQLIGLNTDYASIEDISQSDMIFRFVFNDTVIRVIRAMLGFAVVLLILFCIIAILKSEFEYAQRGGNNSKKQIMVRTLKSIFLMVLVPIISIGAIVLSNAILKTLYMATAGGTDVSMGAQIFVASGYNANAYRRYANNNKKVPITFNFEEVTESDNVTGWGNDGSIAELDEALQAFKSSDVWNRGLTTFLMFYTDAFLDMDSVDKLNSIAKAEGKTSNYHAVYDEGIFTRAEEYYVMADVMDYSLKNHQAIYFKTAEEIYESFYNTLNLAPSEVRNQMGNYMPISKTADGYSFSVFFSGDSSATTYTHIEGETDEAKGAVFMIALEKEIEYNNRVYTYYYPLLSTEDNFATDYYARTRQPVVAKGLFEKGENPTAIKVEDGVVKFYRDDLNVPTLVDFFPTISYELPEGVTQDVGMMIIKAGFQAVTGVSADEFIPYVYYSFDIFNLFTKKSYNLVQLDSGYLALDYNFSQRSLTMENLYKMFDFNIVILVFASIIILGMLLKIIFGLALRVLDVTLLAITYPAVLSTYPLDGGNRFKGWVDMFIKKLVSIYGVVVGVNIVLLLFPAIDNLNLITPTMIQQAISLHWLPSSVTADFLNFLVEILFMLVAFTSIQSAAKIIESLITTSKTEDVGGIISDGEMVVNDLKKLPQTIGNVVTGKIILDVGKKAIDTATSFIPGSAIVADIHDRVKHKTDQAGMQSSIDSLKDDMKSGKSDVLGGENTESPQDDNGGEQTPQETSQETSQGAPQEAPQETSQDAGAENAEQAVDQQVDQSVNEMSAQVEESMGLSEASGGSGVSGADVAGDVADVADTMFSPTSEEFTPARTTADYEREMHGDQPQNNYEAPTSPVVGGAPNSNEANATLEATPDDNEDKANEAEETNSNEEEQNADPNSEAPAENARGAGNSETETQRNNNDDNNNDTGGVTNSYSQPVRLVPKQNREDKRTLETTVNGTLLPIYDSTMQTLNNQIGYRYGGRGGNDIVRNTGNLPSNGSNIIVDESQIETIAQIRNNMARQKGTGLTVEQAFTMLGHKDENGNIIITKVVANQGVFEQNLETARKIQEARRLNPNIKQEMPEAEFTRDLEIAMGKHLHDKSIKNPVVIHGHTHPQSIYGDVSNNYSIHDLWAYRELQATSDAIRDDAQVLGMVINDAADFNVVGFNSSDRQFEKYDNISIGDTRLPSFSRNYGSRGR